MLCVPSSNPERPWVALLWLLEADLDLQERAQRFSAVSVARHCAKQRSISPTAIGSMTKLAFTSWTNSSIPLLCAVESFSLYHGLFRWSHWERERDRNGERKL